MTKTLKQKIESIDSKSFEQVKAELRDCEILLAAQAIMIEKLEAQRAELREWLKAWATRPIASMYRTYSTASLNECYQHVIDKLNEQEVKDDQQHKES